VARQQLNVDKTHDQTGPYRPKGANHSNPSSAMVQTSVVNDRPMASAPFQPASTLRCQRCTRSGHDASQCLVQICTYCRRNGHLVDSCRSKPAYQNIASVVQSRPYIPPNPVFHDASRFVQRQMGQQQPGHSPLSTQHPISQDVRPHDVGSGPFNGHPSVQQGVPESQSVYLQGHAIPPLDIEKEAAIASAAFVAQNVFVAHNVPLVSPSVEHDFKVGDSVSLCHPPDPQTGLLEARTGPYEVVTVTETTAIVKSRWCSIRSQYVECSDKNECKHCHMRYRVSLSRLEYWKQPVAQSVHGGEVTKIPTVPMSTDVTDVTKIPTVQRCQRCHRQGHDVSRCSTRVCAYCRRNGHLIASCWTNPSNQTSPSRRRNGQRVDYCWSSASNQTMPSVDYPSQSITSASDQIDSRWRTRSDQSVPSVPPVRQQKRRFNSPNQSMCFNPRPPSPTGRGATRFVQGQAAPQQDQQDKTTMTTTAPLRHHDQGANVKHLGRRRQSPSKRIPMMRDKSLSPRLSFCPSLPCPHVSSNRPASLVRRSALGPFLGSCADNTGTWNHVASLPSKGGCSAQIPTFESSPTYCNIPMLLDQTTVPHAEDK
jgi:hypothetical protein